jgi:hypothetical protein
MTFPPSLRKRACAPLNAFVPHAKGRLHSDFAGEVKRRRKKRGTPGVRRVRGGSLQHCVAAHEWRKIENAAEKPAVLFVGSLHRNQTTWCNE